MKSVFARLRHNKKGEKPTLKSTLLCLLRCMLLALLLEGTLFNMGFYTHLGNQPTVLQPEQATVQGMERQADGSFLVTDKAKVQLQWQNLNTHVNSLSFRFVRYGEDGSERLTTQVSIEASDAGNALPFTLGERKIVSGVTASQYIQVHLAGNSTELSLYPSLYNGDRLVVEAVELNPHFPFLFSLVRLLLCGLCLWLIYILIPSHGYYRVACAFRRPLQRVIIVVVILFQIGFLTFCSFASDKYFNPPDFFSSQYHRLAVALSKLDLHLGDIPSVPLTAMENPYDPGMRVANDVPALGDTAYYDGYYFCYFGVMGALVFHLPYYLLTGQEFPTYLGVYISSVAAALLAFWLVALLVKRFRQEKVPFLLYLVLSLLLCACFAYPAFYPTVYTLPIALAIVFSLLGLCLWLCAVRDGGLRTGYVFFGSLSMALVSGCRPQLLLASFLAIPIFWDSIVHQRLLFSKKTWLKTVWVLLPYVVIGVLMMGYNYFRFGSPFEFGAIYNITSNDVTKRGFVLARIPSALFFYFLQPVALKAVFPYIIASNQSTSYLGITIGETMYGGVFFTNMVSVASLYAYKAKKLFEKQKPLWWAALICLLFGVVIAVFDAQAGGILERYVVDFEWLMVLSAILVLLAAFTNETVPQNTKKILQCFVGAAFVLGMAYTLLTPLLIRGGSDLDVYNPTLYYSLYYGIQFWL